VIGVFSSFVTFSQVVKPLTFFSFSSGRDQTSIFAKNNGMAIPGKILIKDYDYALPASRIAQFPVERRDESKLLIWKEGKITESIFARIGDDLPSNSILVFNDTKVIHARLIFSKSTGATIEVFCLEPLLPVTEIQASFAQTASCTWKCLVGNVKRWKDGILVKSFILDGKSYYLSAEKKETLGDGCFSITFNWEPSELSFSQILELAGMVPLPPYITRPSAAIDNSRYQTIYAKHEGSVAAPTAGLHFTERAMEFLMKKNIAFKNVTLHVGIGTFRPVSVENIGSHIMHSEKVSVKLPVIKDLAINLQKPVFAIGTTSVRTLESLYWLGVKIIVDGVRSHPKIHQWDPYNTIYDKNIPCSEALSALANYVKKTGNETYTGNTALMIVPGYRFRIVEGMVTNFHMPQSTLLLLVAAFIGQSWRTAYQYALDHDFRFLSYGDACLFFKKE
jgi:S-adenosylmethionine:tRNA ribosyltransferase-isomerase